MERIKTAAIVLAAGQGKRMQADCPKQYLLLNGKPILYYSLKAFEDSCVDEIVLVVGEGEAAYCQKEIIEKYGFRKISQIVSGGKERYNSVFAGLSALSRADVPENDYVFVQDGARPFLTPELVETLLADVKLHNASVAGMPVKDTIKLVDENQNVTATPRRELVWQIQTPQVFSYALLWEAYSRLFEKTEAEINELQITDDAMVVETILAHPVHLVKAGYQNMKITTPEDIAIAETLKSTKFTKSIKPIDIVGK